MTEYDVEIREVVKRFGEQVAVDRVSLGVERGQFLTLLGPSGCGKTTTLRMIGGFEYPDEGEIFIRGEPMGLRPPYRRDSSMVFQSYALFPHMTVAENIAYGLHARKVDKRTIACRVEEMLRLVELPHYGHRQPKQLSGGQQQRVALARSLVLEPTVLLLDEPLGALDLKLRKQMQIELKRIQERVGITFIYVTHDQEEALTMSDQIAVMNRGRVEQVGAVEAIYERPRTRFVADFMGAENLLTAEIIGTEPGESEARVAGTALRLSNGGVDLGRQAILMVRPEKLRLLADGVADAGLATWQGTVANRIYKGSFIDYQVELADGASLIVQTAGGEGTLLQPGEAVRVGLRPSDAVLIPDDAQPESSPAA